MSSFINSFISPLFKRVAVQRYHQMHKKKAEQTLSAIESIKGRIDKSLIRLSDEYAAAVLGWKGFAPWLYVYCAVQNTFKEGWIPDNYFAKVVLPAIDGGYGKISDLRALPVRLFNNTIFPDIAYFVNGLFFSRDYSIINESELKEYLFGHRNVIVFKIDNSMQGKGVFVYNKSTFDVHKIKMLGNGVFQYHIEQHPFFSEFMPTSVATIRITTYYEESGSASVKACFLRIGRSDEQNVKWASNVIIPVNPVTGELNEIGYFLNLNPIYKHPDTNTHFAKQFLPFFDKCIFWATELHKKLPFDRCIGWDMIVDKENNVKIMEWNGHHTDIKIHEAIQGPCFTGLGWEELWKKPR